MCKVTVVTVVYNGESCVEETIQSVLNQKYTDFEYIIKDGNSTDNTGKIVKKYLGSSPVGINYIKNKDEGIYDAMNEAIRFANGEWIIFMNAGDIFYNDEVLKDVFERNYKENIGVLYGHCFMKLTGNRGFVQTYDASLLLRGHSICHQAVFERKEYLLKYPFDCRLKILADREHLLGLISRKIEFKQINAIIVREDRNGLSSVNYPQFFAEAELVSQKYHLKYRKQNKQIGYLKKYLKQAIPKLEEVVMIKKAIKRMV